MTRDLVVRLFSLGCLALLHSGCSLPQAQNALLMKAWTARCKEAADLLVTVQDVPSAKSAAPKILAVMKELRKLDEQLEKTSYESEDDGLVDSPGFTRHGAEAITEMQRLMQESVRIGKDRELRAALGEAWDCLPAAMLLDAEGNFIEG